MDLFDIYRSQNVSRNIPREELERDRHAHRDRVLKFVKLKPGFYFDPVDRVVLRKSGSQYFYYKPDRRHTLRVPKEKAEEAQFRLISGGLYWDSKTHGIYKKAAGHFVLYTKDRRQLKRILKTANKKRRKPASAKRNK